MTTSTKAHSDAQQVAEKSTPFPRGEERAWFDAVADQRLMFQRCQDCGQVPSYPRAQCPQCWSPNLIEQTSSGRGSIYSFTVQHRPGAAGFEADVPYAVALVDMEEGYRVMAGVTLPHLDDIEIGLAVQVAFDGPAGGTADLPYFVPAVDAR